MFKDGFKFRAEGEMVDGKFFGMRIPLVESRFHLISGKGPSGLQMTNDK